MRLFNKFYNADAIETPASTEQTQEPVSLAKMMASQGSKSEGNHGETQSNISENTETPKLTEETPAAIATEAKVEEKVEETPQSIEVKEETQSPTIEVAKTPEPSWQEVAKTQPNEVLKALGFDEQKLSFVSELNEIDPKMVGLLQAYKEGKHVEYLKELSTDYSKLSAEEVMRHQLRKDYPKASEKHIDILFNREVVAAYNLDSDDAELLEEGKLLLEAKADRFRDSLIENQQKFLVPAHVTKTTEPESNNNQALQEAEVAKRIEMMNEQVQNHAFTKNIIANKVLPVGEGDSKWNFPIEPNEVLGLLTDNNKWKQAMFDVSIDGNGKQNLVPKVEHQLLVTTVAKYGMSFINGLRDHFISEGAKKAIAPIDNAKEPDKVNSSNADIKPASTAAAMARAGVYSPGGG